MDKYMSIKEASILIGVTTTTLRRWDSSDSLISHHQTIGNHRRYSMLDVLSLKQMNNEKPYAMHE